MQVLHRYRHALRTVSPAHHHHLIRPRTLAPWLRNMASANLATERFYADRDTPVCSLAVGKSFAQLRCTWTRYESVNFLLKSPLQLKGEKVCALHQPGILGWGAHHPGADHPAGPQAVRPPHLDI